MLVHHKGISPVLSTVLLILIALSISITIYYSITSTVRSEVSSLRERLKLLSKSMLQLSIVDSFYIASNQTVVIYIYYNDKEVVIFDKAYVNNEIVPNANYVSGFGTPLKYGEINRFSFVYSLTSGTYTIIITGTKGERIEFFIEI